MADQPTLRLVSSRDLGPDPSSSLIERPVTSDSRRRFLPDGVDAPLSHSQTVGCLTPIKSAKPVCEVPFSSSHRRSRSIEPSIGKSYSASIGNTYSPQIQTAEMAKESFWTRVLEALADMNIREDQQTVVAKMIGVKQPSVWEWANEDSLPSMANARKLATKLGVSLDWLMMGDSAKIPPPKGDAWADALWRHWGSLDEDQKAKLVGQVVAGVPQIKRRS
jgi:transcriptional regulator with XRE-family HTH domain